MNKMALTKENYKEERIKGYEFIFIHNIKSFSLGELKNCIKRRI